jgi:hypothetical protein
VSGRAGLASHAVKPSPDSGDGGVNATETCKSLTNPYLTIFLRLHASRVEDNEHRAERLWKWRKRLTRSISWAVPSEEALETLVKASPILEIGAGTGYWARMVRSRGGVVDAYDINCQEGTGVLRGDAEVVGHYGEEWTLMLCWPPLRGTMASRALEAFRGHNLVYIGEPDGGCTGTPLFHQLLEAGWDCTGGCDIPQWNGVHDRLYTYRRRG